MRESEDERRPNPTKGTRPPLTTDREGFRVRGEGDLDGLERGTGGQDWVWRLTGRGSGREEREKRGGRLLGVDDSLESV